LRALVLAPASRGLFLWQQAGRIRFLGISERELLKTWGGGDHSRSQVPHTKKFAASLAKSHDARRE